MNAFRDILATPFGWLLSFFYEVSGNYLLSLIVITLIMKLVLLPLSVKQQKNSAKQMRLQAKVNKIRQKYASLGREGQMKISQETQELYQREGFNASTAGCLPMGLQLIVMLGLYGAIYSPLTRVLHISSEAVSVLEGILKTLPGQDKVTQIELGIMNKFSEIVPQIGENTAVTQQNIADIQTFIDKFKVFGIPLTEYPKDWKTVGGILLLIPILAGVTSLFTALYTYLKQRKTNPEMAKNPAMGCMTLMSPLMSLFFSFSFSAGIGVYWIISNILAFIQIVALDIFIKPDEIIAGEMIDETVQRRSREESIKKAMALTQAAQNNQ